MDDFLGQRRERRWRRQRSHFTTGNIVALIFFGSAAGLFAALIVFLWQHVGDLPDRERFVAASQLGADGNPEVPVAPLPLEPQAPVRQVLEGGVAGPEITGPLRRAPSTVELPEPPGPQPERYRLVVIEGANLINVRSHSLSLNGITAPEPTAECTTLTGRTWPCGRRARTALRRLVRRRALECMPLEEEFPEDRPLVADCSVAGTDLAAWLVEYGWASPTESAPETLLALHNEAKSKARGLFNQDPR